MWIEAENLIGAVTLGTLDSEAEVAAHVGEGYWSAEGRLPVSPEGDHPLHTIVGRPPSRSMPWYFNMGRKRGGTEDEETSIYSPGGDSFHDLMMFGELYVR